MKNLFAAVALVFPLLAQAGVSIDLRDASVPMVIETFFRGVMNRDYVVQGQIPPDKRMTVFVRDLAPADAMTLIADQLRVAGFSVTDRDGVTVIAPSMPSAVSSTSSESAPASDVEKEEVASPRRVYIARWRPVDYLASVVSSFQSVKHVVQSVDRLTYIASDDDDKMIQELLAQLDVALPSVTVRAALIEVMTSQDEARSFQAAVSLLAGKLTASVAAGSKLVSGALAIKTSSVDSVLSMLEGDTRFRLVSRPTVNVLSGETATLAVGSEVPVRGQVSVTNNGQTLQGIDYRSGGLSLSVTPRVAQESITLKIDQQLSSFAVTTTSNIDSPTMLKRRMTSTIQTTPGNVVMLAGLDEEKQTDNRSGLSFLPDRLHAFNQTRSNSQLVLLLEVE